jgi:hypothetical protein
MSVLGVVFFPIGVFLILIGVVLMKDAPFMKEILDQVEYLRKNRRLVGTVFVILGFILIAFS